jgi:PEP-CTERM motif
MRLSLFVGIYIPPTATGTQTFQVILTPTAVPEPSSLVLGLIGANAGIGYGARQLGRVRK